MRHTRYLHDEKQIEALGPARLDFEAWMVKLDHEHKGAGGPYGAGDIWDMTGPACWIDYFKDGFSPGDALKEDLSN